MQLGLNANGFALVGDTHRHPPGPIAGYVERPEIRRGRTAECQQPCARPLGHVRDKRIVDIQNADAASRQPFHQDALLASDRFAAAIIREMIVADRRHHTDLRLERPERLAQTAGKAGVGLEQAIRRRSVGPEHRIGCERRAPIDAFAAFADRGKDGLG